jgi:ATP-binding cassette subfamily C protein
MVNLLMLAGPLYMLQIYDRVLSSRSVPTLVALSIFLVAAYAFQGVLELIRFRIVVRAAALLDCHLSTKVLKAVIAIGSRNTRAAEGNQPVRDLDQIRAFLTSSGPIAIIDLPWMPVFLAICFLIHPLIGYVSFACMIVLMIMTLLTERASRSFAQTINEQGGSRIATAEADRRNSGTAIAMGMTGVLAERWSDINERFVNTATKSADLINSYGSITKVLRLLMQSSMLGLGAYLVLQNEMTAGAMIAASIMMARALSPIEVAIANWRSFVAARGGINRLSMVLSRVPSDETGTMLPKPTQHLELDHVTVVAPGTTQPIVSDVRFRLNAGDVCGIIGPNGSGKSSLARVLVAIWPPARGTVRLDGATPDQWDGESWGRNVGYASQSIELFDGTIAENIARMRKGPDDEAVLAAAREAGVHDMILRLSSGYDTKVGDGESLSQGQQQRIALARALYGDPFLVVLDEPGANLDLEGEVALQTAIRRLKARGAIVIMIVHRRSSLALCDKILVLYNGTQQAFGPRDEVLRNFGPKPASAPAASGSNLKVVADAAAPEAR